jgi:hypothetical protein
MVFHREQQTFYVFGGTPSRSFYNDFWACSLKSMQWTMLSSEGAPTPRFA